MLFYAANASSQSSQVFSWTGTTEYEWVAFEVSSIKASSPRDPGAGSGTSGTSTTATTPSITTFNSTDLVIAAFYSAGALSSPTNSYKLIDSKSGSSRNIAVYGKPVSSTGSQSSAVTVTPSSAWLAMIDAYEKA